MEGIGRTDESKGVATVKVHLVVKDGALTVVESLAFFCS